MPDFQLAADGREALGSAKPLGETHCPPWGGTFSPEEIEALATFVEALAPGTDAPREQR